MREAEQQYGMDTPLVVFTDQTPVDSDLNAIAPSLMRLQRQNPQAKDYRQILWRVLSEQEKALLQMFARSHSGLIFKYRHL